MECGDLQRPHSSPYPVIGKYCHAAISVISTNFYKFSKLFFLLFFHCSSQKITFSVTRFFSINILPVSEFYLFHDNGDNFNSHIERTSVVLPFSIPPLCVSLSFFPFFGS